MSTKPIISIITIYKDDKISLIRTLNSLALQCVDNIEWIIIDGSSDKLPHDFFHVQKISTKYVHGKDHGIYDAMNKGIFIANGDYLNFLNAGDVLASSDSLSKAKELLRHHSCDLLSMGSISVFGKWKYLRLPSKLRKYLKVTMPGSHQSTFYSSKFLRRNCLFYDKSYKVCGDYDLYQKILTLSPVLAFSDYIYVYFDTSGVSSLRPLLLVTESITVSFKHLPILFAICASLRCLFSVFAFQIVRFF